MKRLILPFTLVFALALAFVAFRTQDASAPPPVSKLAPGYVSEYTNTTTGASTTYHTIDGWFWEPADLGLQINANELTGTTTMDLTVQSSNDLGDGGTWIDLWSPAAWSADEDTIINIANTAYGRYRLKWVQAGAGTWTPTSWLIVKE